MKRFLKFFAAAVMASAALFACKKDEVQPETLEVTPSEDLHFLAKGNEDVILTVNTGASSYEVDADSWVITRKDGNKLTVNVEDNKSAERSCEMTITAGTSQPVVIKITQDEGEPDAISVEPQSLLFTATGAAPQTLAVTTSLEKWDYELSYGEGEEDGWFTVAKDEADAKKLTVTVKDYSETDGSRKGSITFTAGEAKTVVPVVQSAKDMISVTPSEGLSFSWKADQEGKKLEVSVLTASEDAGWDFKVAYSGEQEDWITTEKDAVENVLVVKVTENQSQEARTASVTFTAGNAEPVVISVSQEGKPAPVAATFKDKSGSDEVTLTYSASGISATVVLELASALESGSAGATVVTDESYLDTYNSENSTSYSLFPTANVTIPDEGRISISGASTSGSLDLTLNPAELDPGTYLLPLKVTDITGNISVSENKDRVNYIVTVPAPAPERPYKNIMIFEVNSVNPLNALEMKFEDGSPFFDGVVLFSSNIVFDQDAYEVRFKYNNNVQALLENADTYVRPLQNAGIKVYLSLLGDHTAAWLSNLLPNVAASFADEVADVVRRYRLDGVMLDDEYKGTSPHPNDFPDLFYNGNYANPQAYSRLAYELKMSMKEKCDWETEILLFQASGDRFYDVDSTPVKDFLDVVIQDYTETNVYYSSQMGLGLENLTCRSIGLGGFSDEGKNVLGSSTINKMPERGKYIAWYNLNLDPNSSEFNYVNSVPRVFQQVATLMFESSFLTPTGYYSKIGEGQYDPARHTYDSFPSGDDWQDFYR